MARKRKITKKDGITYRLKYGEQINKDQKVSGKTALSNIVRPMSVVDIATRGGKPVTTTRKKRIGEHGNSRGKSEHQKMMDEDSDKTSKFISESGFKSNYLKDELRESSRKDVNTGSRRRKRKVKKESKK